MQTSWHDGSNPPNDDASIAQIAKHIAPILMRIARHFGIDGIIAL